MNNFLIAATAALALSLGGCKTDLDNTQQGNAERGGFQFARAITGAVFGSCSGRDSDGDGYVSCTYTMPNQPKPIEILCPYNSVGCKLKPEDPKKR